MTQDKRNRAKRFNKAWAWLGLACAGAVIFHQPLLLLGCKALLMQSIPCAEGRIVTYDKMQWEEGKIVISGFIVKDPDTELMVDKIELKLSGDFFRLCFKPKVTVIHPQILLSDRGSSQAKAFPFFYRSRFLQPEWTIANGVFQLPSSSRFYFSMDPGVEQEVIGSIKFSYDPNPLLNPMFTAQLAMREKRIQIGFHLQEDDISRLLPLTALVLPDAQREWEKALGELDIEGLISLGANFEIEEIHTRGEAKGLALVSSKMGIALECDEAQGSFSFPVGSDHRFFWDKLLASFSIKNGQCVFSEPLFAHGFGMRHLSGHIDLAPQTEPEITLSGAFVQEQREIDFSLCGKGSVQEDSTFWSEIALVLTAPRGDQMQSLFSLCSHEEGLLAVHVSIEDASFEHLDFFRAFAGLPGECVEGLVSAEATFHCKEGICQSVFVENCSLNKIRWYFPEPQISVFSEQITGDCAFVLNARQKWEPTDLHIQIEEGEYLDPRLHLNGLSTDIAIDNGVLQPSSLKTKWGALSTEVAFLGPKADHLADMRVEGDLNQLLGILYPETASLSLDLPLRLEISANLDGNLLSLDGEGTISQEKIEGSASFIMASMGLREVLAGNFPKWQLKDGSFSAECLTEKSYGAFVPLLLPEGAMTGSVQCEAVISSSRIHLKLAGHELHINHPVAKLYVPIVKNIPAQFFYDAASKKWRGEIPLSEARVQSVKSGFAIENIEGSLKWDGSFLKGSFESLTFPVNAATRIKQARCDLSFDSKDKRLNVERAEGVWELKDKTPLTVQLKQISTQLCENCSIDFGLRVIDGKKEFAQFEGNAVYSSSGWNVLFDAKATHFGGTQLNISQCVLNSEMRIASFEMKPILKCQDLQHQAAFLQNAGFLSSTFSPKNLQEWQLEGTLQTQLITDDVSKGFSFHAQSRDLKVKGESWTSFQLHGQKIGEKWLIERLEADGILLKGAFVVDADGFSFPQFEGSWQGLAMKGSGYVKDKEKRFYCTLESIKGDLSALKVIPKSTSAASPKGTFMAALALTGDFSDANAPLQILGEANFYADLQSPMPLTLRSKRALKFNYRKKDGISCGGIDLELKHKHSGAFLADLQADKLSLSESADVSLQQIQFSVAPALFGYAIDAKIFPSFLKDLEWEGNLEGSADFQMIKKATVFQGNLKSGRYGFDGNNLPFEQLQIRYEKDLLNLRAKTTIEEMPLWGSLQIDMAKAPYGMLKLFDNPKAEGMKLLFSTQGSKVILESAQGSCYGLSCSLGKSTQRKIPSATVLTGEIKVDGNALSTLLPKEVRQAIQNLKVGKGYQWRGDLVLWDDPKKGFLANGALSGKEFEALGYRFRSLEGGIEANSQHVILSNLKIEDPSGAIAIKKIELNKQEEWELYIPQVAVRQLQPSLMRKVGAEPSEVKPFTIKNFTLTDIRGRLGDKSTLEGSGHLMFVNQFKKEASILDVPLDMIKKIGLDIGILTPVQGEIQMELRGDKFYLVSLDNSFSDGDRAEFYLSPEKDISYIDLDGKMHIDLKMRQDVVLKITEPFTLTIRGTLDKPRYGLQY